MFYLINKDDNKVRMVSESIIEFDENKFYVKEIDDDEFEGYQMHFDGKKLVKEENPKLDTKQDIRDKIDSAQTLEEIKTIIKDLI